MSTCLDQQIEKGRCSEHKGRGKRQIAGIVLKLRVVVHVIVLQVGSWMLKMHKSQARVRCLTGPWGEQSPNRMNKGAIGTSEVTSIYAFLRSIGGPTSCCSGAKCCGLIFKIMLPTEGSEEYSM